MLIFFAVNNVYIPWLAEKFGSGAVAHLALDGSMGVVCASGNHFKSEE
jgi:hypothetical protein